MESLVLEFVVRAALIAAAAAVILFVLRIRTAAAQHAVWTGVLLLMLALPGLILLAPKVAVPVLPSTGRRLSREIAPYYPPSSAAATQRVEETSAPVSAPAGNWRLIWIGGYLLGAGVLLLRLAVGTVRANRLNSAACAVPVTVGLFRPRLILPEGWKEWPPAQLDAVLTHEHAHARRRDPLVQWIALFNRAVFWFHPLAWWLERRLSALAEEACDAAVLQQGHDPRDYSNYLLELARAVQRAGVRVNVTGMAMPGSYLPQRIRKIIAGVSAPPVSSARLASTFIACAVCSAMLAAGKLEHTPQIQVLPVVSLAVPAPLPQAIPTPAEPVKGPPPVLLAQTQPPPVPPIPPQPPKPLEFDAASVKPTSVPDGITIFGDGRRMMRKGAGLQMPRNTGGPGTADPGRIHFPLITLKELLTRAYSQYYRINGPGWMDSEAFAIEATMPAETTQQQFEEMLRTLISDRFQLQYHSGTKEVISYVLSIAKNGSKMKESPNQNEAVPDVPGPRPRPSPGPDGFMVMPPRPGPWTVTLNTGDGRARMVNQQQTMQDFAKRLGFMLDSIVTDGTGLSAKYDFTVTFAGRLDGARLLSSPPASPPDDVAPLPDIFSALPEQLGLMLEKKKVPVQEMVVDHVEKTPASN